MPLTGFADPRYPEAPDVGMCEFNQVARIDARVLAVSPAHDGAAASTVLAMPCWGAGTRTAEGWCGSPTLPWSAIMKSLLHRAMRVAAVLVLAVPAPAVAQIDGSIEFKTSFRFSLGTTTVGAGRYTITATENSTMLELKGEGTSVLFAADSADCAVAPMTELVFDRDGDRYVLKNIWIGGSTTGYAVAPAAAEVATPSEGVSNEHRVPARKRAPARPWWIPRIISPS